MSELRRRFRDWLDAGDRRWVAPALAGAGLSQIASQIVALYGEERPTALTIPREGYFLMLAIWPFFTVAMAWIHALLLRWTGRFLGGVATARELVAAQGWSLMPVALAAPLLAAEAIALVRGAATPEENGELPSMAAALVAFAFGVTTVMAVIRMFISVSQAQKITKLRVLANFALSFVLVFLLVLVPAALLVLLSGGAPPA